jgi:aryl-alcohol dehydrogenase-like predicted oxidoreductase
MFFGTKTDKDASHRVLDGYAHWIEGGFGGESETLLGEWMRLRGNRSALFIASKVGFAYSDAERGLRASQIEEECNKSLKRMGIDTIDLYYAHVDDRDTPLEESLEAFDRLVKAGKVRFVGASNYLAWWLGTVLLHPTAIHLSARKTGRDLWLSMSCAIIASTMECPCWRMGFCWLEPIPDQFDDPVNEPRHAVLQDVAAETGATVNQVILKWMMQSSPPIIPLIAASTDAQLAENLGTLDIDLSAEQMEGLTTAGIK